MTDLKKIFEEAVSELESENDGGLNIISKDLISISRKYYYSESSSQGKIKEMKKIILDSLSE